MHQLNLRARWVTCNMDNCELQPFAAPSPTAPREKSASTKSVRCPVLIIISVSLTKLALITLAYWVAGAIAIATLPSLASPTSVKVSHCVSKSKYSHRLPNTEPRCNPQIRAKWTTCAGPTPSAVETTTRRGASAPLASRATRPPSRAA